MQSEGSNVFDWHGGPFLLFFWSLSALSLAYAFWRKGAELRPLDAVFPIEPLDAYHVARLRDAKDGAIDVALAVCIENAPLSSRPAANCARRGAMWRFRPLKAR